jgi:hypothetical protein
MHANKMFSQTQMKGDVRENKTISTAVMNISPLKILHVYNSHEMHMAVIMMAEK